MYEITILGFGKYTSKAGATKYAVAFSCNFKDNLSRITSGVECATDHNVDPETYARISACKVGDKIKAAVCRENYQMHIVCLI